MASWARVSGFERRLFEEYMHHVTFDGAYLLEYISSWNTASSARMSNMDHMFNVFLAPRHGGGPGPAMAQHGTTMAHHWPPMPPPWAFWVPLGTSWGSLGDLLGNLFVNVWFYLHKNTPFVVYLQKTTHFQPKVTFKPGLAKERKA